MALQSQTLKRNQKRTELECALYVVTKMAQEKAEEKDGKGVIFNKGDANEIRMTYDDVVEIMDDLWGYFEMYERFAKSHCGKCVDFKSVDKTVRGVGACGKCKQRSNDTFVHRFSGCDIGRKRKK